MTIKQPLFLPIDGRSPGDMCLTTHAIFGKSGTLTLNEECEIGSIILGKNIYRIEISKLVEEIQSQAVSALLEKPKG